MASKNPSRAHTKAPLRHRKKRAFLAAIANGASRAEAARLAGIDRPTHYRWLKTDPEYARQFVDAWEQSGEALEERCIAFALNGIPDLVRNSRGEVVMDEVTRADGSKETRPAMKRWFNAAYMAMALKLRGRLKHDDASQPPAAERELSQEDVLGAYARSFTTGQPAPSSQSSANGNAAAENGHTNGAG